MNENVMITADEYRELVDDYDLLVEDLKLAVDMWNGWRTSCKKVKKENDLLKEEFSRQQWIVDNLMQALLKACDELENLDKAHAHECNKQLIEKTGSSQVLFGYQKADEWLNWCLSEDLEDETNE